MKYSVIIPVYNAELTLRRCVDSLLQQNYHAAEIILINDGSKDRSGLICQEYATAYDRIRYIEQLNAGASAARNRGLDASVGEYVTFVDSDDYVSEDYFETLDTSSADFSIFAHRTIRSDGVHKNHLSQNLKTAETGRDVIYHVVADRLPGPVAKKFRRSIIEENQIRFRQDLIIGEDFIFGLEFMLCCESAQAIDHPLYWVDETGTDSITRAARYDLSQFVLMYRYAFSLAESCSWPTVEKEGLIRLLDYLYCRTVFARTGYCLQEKKDPHKRAISLIRMFREDYQRDICPMSKSHAFMQWCVKHGVVPVFFAVGYAHIMGKKLIRK